MRDLQRSLRTNSLQVRFIAEWIAAQHTNEFGDWDPDRDEYEFTVHNTLEDAQRSAVESGRAAGVVEWARVIEERRGQHGWDEVRYWSGDWDGNWDGPISLDID